MRHTLQAGQRATSFTQSQLTNDTKVLVSPLSCPQSQLAGGSAQLGLGKLSHAAVAILRLGLGSAASSRGVASLQCRRREGRAGGEGTSLRAGDHRVCSRGVAAPPAAAAAGRSKVLQKSIGRSRPKPGLQVDQERVLGGPRERQSATAAGSAGEWRLRWCGDPSGQRGLGTEAAKAREQQRKGTGGSGGEGGQRWPNTRATAAAEAMARPSQQPAA